MFFSASFNIFYLEPFGNMSTTYPLRGNKISRHCNNWLPAFRPRARLQYHMAVYYNNSSWARDKDVRNPVSTKTTAVGNFFHTADGYPRLCFLSRGFLKHSTVCRHCCKRAFCSCFQTPILGLSPVSIGLVYAYTRGKTKYLFFFSCIIGVFPTNGETVRGRGKSLNIN